MSSASLILSAFTMVVGCSSSSDPSGANGGSDQGQAGNASGGRGESGASSSGAGEGGSEIGEGGSEIGEGGSGAGEGGASSSAAGERGAEAGEGGVSAGGSNAGGASAGAGGSNPTSSPCSYSVSGGQTFPEGDAMYVCTVNSSVYQKSGKGKFNVLIGAGFSTTSGDTSTFACNMDSVNAPKAGDTWTMNNADYPANCELSFSQNQVASLWHATSSPLLGEVSIKFNSVSVKNGMYHPEDIYYLYDLTITAKLKGQTEGATDVTVTSRFINMGLPLGA